MDVTDVLVTGAYGRCGTALADHLDPDDYELVPLDRSPPPTDADDPYDADPIVADVSDADAVREAVTALAPDAIVHLAACPRVDAAWDDLLGPNVLGVHHVLEAAREAAVESIVFASSNHVVGGYEDEHAPELYEPRYGLVLDAAAPVRPDSSYGTTKAFGEALCRQFADAAAAPDRCYALRIGSVRGSRDDHPYADAERGVEAGEFERGSAAYREQVARTKATWQSRRDFAALVDCCLRDDTVDYGVFYGVSDNARRWFDLEDARAKLGYRPVDDAEAFDGPPG
jgi:nucleoside-diphosphate-sugar epimerase